LRRQVLWLGEFPCLLLSWLFTDKTRSYLGGNILVENDNAKALGWKAKAPGILETLTTMAKSG
jgi:hypothetical protein